VLAQGTTASGRPRLSGGGLGRGGASAGSAAVLVAVLLPLSFTAYRTLRQAKQAMDRAENEVRAAVAAEAWAQQHTAHSVDMTGAR